MSTAMIQKIKTLKRFLTPLLTLLTLFFIAKYLFDHRSALQTVLHEPNYVFLGISLGLFLLYMSCRVLGWRVLMKGLGVSLTVADAFSIWTLSEAARYVPGNIWSVLGRVNLLKKKGVPAALSVQSWLSESAAVVYASGIAALMLGCIAYNQLLLCMMTLFLGVSLFSFLQTRLTPLVTFLAHTFTGKTLAFPHVSRLVILIYSVGWICFGYASAVLIHSLTPMTFTNISWVASFSVAAWIIGYVSILTPMGLGVREGIFILLTAPLLSPVFASFASLATRVWFVGCELFLLLLIFLFKNLRSRK